MTEAEHALQGIQGIAFQQLSRSDIVRHPIVERIVERIVEAYERYRA